MKRRSFFAMFTAAAAAIVAAPFKALAGKPKAAPQIYYGCLNGNFFVAQAKWTWEGAMGAQQRAWDKE